MGLNILIGVTGSVATLKLADLIRELCRVIPGVKLRVVATENSMHFFEKSKMHVDVITDADEWKVL